MSEGSQIILMPGQASRHYPDQSVVNLGDCFQNPATSQVPPGSRNPLDASLTNQNQYGTDLALPQTDLTVVHSLDISNQHNNSSAAAASAFWPSQITRESHINQK